MHKSNEKLYFYCAPPWSHRQHARYWFISWIYIIRSGKWFILIYVPLLDLRAAFATCLCYENAIHLKLRATENDWYWSACLYYENAIHLKLRATENDWYWSACLCYENAIHLHQLGASGNDSSWSACLCYENAIHLQQLGASGNDSCVSSAATCHWK